MNRGILRGGIGYVFATLILIGGIILFVVTPLPFVGIPTIIAGIILIWFVHKSRQVTPTKRG